MTVKYDYDHEYNFDELKTYRWVTQNEADPNGLLAKNTIVAKRIRTAVDNELQAKGLTKVEENADLAVNIYGGVKERMQIHTHRGRYGWYDPWWGPYGGYTDVSYYEEGTMVIDIISLKTKELAWRGIGTGILKDYSNHEKMQQDIDAAVAQIMAKYPPPVQ
jgi:hypothetical protein